MAGLKGLPKEGVTFSHRVVEPCLQGGEGRQDLLQRLIDLSRTVNKLDRMVRLRGTALSDLQ